jgi:hypothetical protein
MGLRFCLLGRAVDELLSKLKAEVLETVDKALRDASPSFAEEIDHAQELFHLGRVTSPEHRCIGTAPLLQLGRS